MGSGHEGLVVDIKPQGEEVRIALRGELDIATVPRVQTVLVAIARHDPSAVVLDLSDLTFIDSAGTRTLATTARKARERWQVRVEGVTKPVRRVVELLGVQDDLLPSDG